MDRKRLGWLLAGLGAALLALSALADPVGVGDGSGVGYKQVIGMIVGVGIALAGLALVYRRSDAQATNPTSK